MRCHILLFAALLLMSPLVARAVVINEVMPDPGGIDWNGDGIVGPAAADEFVEIVNPADTSVDISGWRIINGPSAVHIFVDPTILPPGGSIVVFGYPPGDGIPGLAVASSAGGLSLSNSAEQITLDDGVLAVDTASYQVSYAAVSWNLDPDGSGQRPGTFSRHDGLPGSIGGGSPGKRANGDLFITLDVNPKPFINEWLPNPNTLVNDWNGDGFGDDAHDEFVEILNPESGVARDIGGWTIEDGFSTRHVFDAGTLLPAGAAIVVIANGTPIGIPGLTVAASSGQLAFNNAGGDTIRLTDGDTVVSTVSYADQTPDVSWNRSPDGDPDATNFVLHTAASNGAFVSSPGLQVDGRPFGAPEPDGAVIIALGALASLARLRRSGRAQPHR